MRKNFWYRAGPLGPLGAAALALWAGGCSGDNGNKNNDMGTTGGDGTVALAPATTSGSYSRPFDSVPDSGGNTFYFIAMDPTATDAKTGEASGAMGIFSVPAGGGAAKKIFSGAPLSAPFSIAISGDDKTLFVADRRAGEDAADDLKAGGIYSLPVSGGTPALVGGTAKYGPRAVEVSGDQLYFTGADPADGMAGVFRTGVGGGSPSVVAKGDPFRDPSGLSIAGSGDIYVADSLTDTSSLGNIVKVSGGTASVFVKNLSLGFPAGIAVTMNGKTLLVSAQDLKSNTSVVDVIDVATQKVSVFNQGIETSADSGGLHRAAKADVLSWCGVTVGNGGSGTVFQVTFK